MASYIPRSGSLFQKVNCDSYFRMMSRLPSVEPPSMMMYSRLGYCWASTERMVASRYRAELKTGVTSEIFGHGPCAFRGGLNSACEMEAGSVTRERILQRPR